HQLQLSSIRSSRPHRRSTHFPYPTLFRSVSVTEDAIIYEMERVPPKRVALLLGTSKHTTKGGFNKYFQERIAAAAELYKKGLIRSEEHTSELQSRENLVCRLLREKRNNRL